jgi:hypothetical protein
MKLFQGHDKKMQKSEKKSLTGRVDDGYKSLPTTMGRNEKA